MAKIKDFPWHQRPFKIIYRFFKKRFSTSNQQAISSTASIDSALVQGTPLDEGELDKLASLEHQLAETQELLERYFKRCEMLEFELLKYRK